MATPSEANTQTNGFQVNHRISKRVGIVIGALLVTGALAGTAAAVLTSDAGGAQLRVDKRTNNLPSTTSSTTFIDLPGANVVVSVPANQSRLYDVPFFAESRCAGPNGGGWCSVRIIATNIATGVSTELNPRSGLDYAFDSDMAGAANDLWEGHGMERSRRLPGGANGANYRIRVQYAVTNNTIAFTLDDWHLAVHTNQ
jgi:hypothetical protein